VLIVDEDASLSLCLQSYLTRRNFDVSTAANGDEAIRLAAEHAPDVVLMDIGMPGLDGIDATRAIRARDAAQHIVIYTGSGEYADVGRADEAGATGFLHKDALTSPDLPDAIQVLHTNYVSGHTDQD